MMQLKPQEKNRKRSNKSLWVKMQRSSCRRYDLEEGALIYYRFCIHNNTTKKKRLNTVNRMATCGKKYIYIKPFDGKGESDSRTPPRDKQRK